MDRGINRRFSRSDRSIAKWKRLPLPDTDSDDVGDDDLLRDDVQHDITDTGAFMDDAEHDHDPFFQ